ncbi:MAG: HAD-IA family hydrolase [Elusimicrobiota bacterium]
MIKYLFLDMGGTLIEPHPSVGEIYADVAAVHGLKISAGILNQKFRDVWARTKGNRQTLEKSWWRSIVEEIFSPYKFDNKEAFFKDLYEEFSKKERWREFPEVRETLNKLKQKQISLAVASNWDERLPSLLRKMELEVFFDHQFISYALEVSKPDPRFFSRALETIGVKSHEVIHVGDDDHEDRGAEQVGIKFLLIDRKKKKEKSTNVIHSLNDILEFV